MGTEEFSRFNAKETSVKACADMLIAAAPEHVATVVEANNRHSFPGLVTFACRNDQQIPANLIAAAQVLVCRAERLAYPVRDGVPVVARPWALHRSVHPAFGVASTLSDQLRYARFHLGETY